MKIGIIACAHGNGKAAAKLCKAYKREGVDIIALCGDLGDDFKEITAVLSAVAHARVPVIAFPGSHEPVVDYVRALKKYPHIIDGFRKRRVTLNNYDLVILPGSSVNIPGAGFHIRSVQSLKKLVRNPAQTIVLCHDPPHSASKNSIDVAYSGIATKSFLLKTNKGFVLYERGSIIPQPFAAQLARKQCPLRIKQRNVGMKGLKAFLTRKHIRFFACGHIHEAGQRAITAAGKRLRQEQWSSSVWYNAAAAVNGKGGMLIIKNNKGTFKNITV